MFFHQWDTRICVASHYISNCEIFTKHHKHINYNSTAINFPLPGIRWCFVIAEKSFFIYLLFWLTYGLHVHTYVWLAYSCIMEKIHFWENSSAFVVMWFSIHFPCNEKNSYPLMGLQHVVQTLTNIIFRFLIFVNSFSSGKLKHFSSKRSASYYCLLENQTIIVISLGNSFEREKQKP